MKTKNKKHKQIESHYLAIILIVFLLLEGVLFSTTELSDWQQGIKVLDISTEVSTVVSDIGLVMQPMFDTMANVNKFYELAATEMIVLLEPSDNDMISQTGLVVSGVFEFYDQASVELSSLLDISSNVNWLGSVAGMSITAE